MSHNHNHSCSCSHPQVKYCSHCKTVYCLDCNQEWTAKTNWSWAYQPWYGNANGSGTLGPSYKGGSLTVSGSDAEFYKSAQANPADHQLTSTACNHAHQ